MTTPRAPNHDHTLPSTVTVQPKTPPCLQAGPHLAPNRDPTLPPSATPPCPQAGPYLAPISPPAHLDPSVSQAVPVERECRQAVTRRQRRAHVRRALRAQLVPAQVERRERARAVAVAQRAHERARARRSKAALCEVKRHERGAAGQQLCERPCRVF
eukprot:351077-Chlamydomonas_euryale.AAC.6